MRFGKLVHSRLLYDLRRQEDDRFGLYGSLNNKVGMELDRLSSDHSDIFKVS